MVALVTFFKVGFCTFFYILGINKVGMVRVEERWGSVVRVGEAWKVVVMRVGEGL